MDVTRLHGRHATVSLCLAAASLVFILGCNALTGLGTLNSQVGDDLSDDPVDLSNDDGVCDASYHNDDFGYGLDVAISASEAPGFVADPDAEHALAWVFDVDRVTITLDAAVFPASFPANLSLLVEAANEVISLGGGTANPPVDLVVANGDAALLSSFTLDGVFGYRVDVVKHDYQFAVTASVADVELTQRIDNAMISAVTSLCVD